MKNICTSVAKHPKTLLWWEKVEWPQEPRLQARRQRQGKTRATTKQPENQVDNQNVSDLGPYRALGLYQRLNHYTIMHTARDKTEK
jgi:hypothetical protein